MPNNREWALLFWVLVLLVWAICRRETRASLRRVLTSLAEVKVLTPLLGLVIWSAAPVHVGSTIGLWDPSLMSGTVLWLLATGLVLLFNMNEVSAKENYFRRKALATLELSVFVQAYSELFVLNLAAEIVLQPAFAILGGMSVVASQRHEHQQVKKLVDALVVLGSLMVLAYGTSRLVEEWASIDRGGLLAELALPIWLTLGVLPFIYLVGLYSAYETAFKRIGLKSTATRRDRLRSKLVLAAAFHIKARELGTFSGPWQFRLAETRSFRESRRVIQEFRRSERERLQDADDAQRRLERYVGHPGADDEGRRLDRREFEATTRGLRWLATCQMGWHRNRGGRYRQDLLKTLNDDFTSYGLPKPSGIVMEVSEAGDSWYAWRRTVTGWIFAIGASGPPPDQWVYDGAEAPTGFPGEDPAWGASSFAMDMSPNW